MLHAQPPRRPGPGSGAGRGPDDDRVDLRVTRVQPPRAAPSLAVGMWIVAGLFIVAVVKPWGAGARGGVPATLRPDVAVASEVTPVPTEDRSATGLAVPVCLGAGAWRIATLETWRGRDVRVWRAIEPVVDAAGPLDPTIPAVPVVADVLSGLGWCAPAFGPDMPVGPARVRAWQAVDGIARPVPLRQVQPVDGVTPIAALYLPVTGAWSSGLVVFEYRDEGTGSARWFGAALQVTSPSPPPSPAQ